MKFEGRDLNRPTGTFSLFRDEGDQTVEIQVPIIALPPRFHTMLERKLGKRPKPPQKPGQQMLNGKTQPIYDHDDPKYLEAIDLYEGRVMAAMVYYGTAQGKETVQFESPGEGVGRDFAAFCDDVLKELEGFLGEGELPLWATAIQSLGQTGTDEVFNQSRLMFRGRPGMGELPEEPGAGEG